MGEVQKLTGFQRDLLFVISGLDEPKGLDVKEKLEEYYQTEIRHGRLYPNLDALVETGFVDKGQHDRRTNKYTLTEDGTRALRERLAWQQESISQELADRIPA